MGNYSFFPLQCWYQHMQTYSILTTAPTWCMQKPLCNEPSLGDLSPGLHDSLQQDGELTLVVDVSELQFFRMGGWVPAMALLQSSKFSWTIPSMVPWKNAVSAPSEWHSHLAYGSSSHRLAHPFLTDESIRVPSAPLCWGHGYKELRAAQCGSPGRCPNVS